MTKTTQTQTNANEKSYDNEKRIVIFTNNQRVRTNDPIMRGNFVLDGKTYNINLWTKALIKDGKQELYLQGTVKPADVSANASTDVSGFFDANQAQ